MELGKLFKGLPVVIKGAKTVKVEGICMDSRCVAPRDLFIAKKGAQGHGTDFAHQAVAAGASAILSDVFDPFIKVPQILHNDPGSLQALLAARFYREPSKDLFCVGVTGTKGKTTTTYYTHHFLQPAGLMGTIETITQKHRFASTLTTHDSIYNQKMLRTMLDEGCKAAVIEVSSHGLVQGRVDEIDFDVGIFLNLSPDHLDYHQTMDQYRDAKKQLMKKAKATLVNIDDPLGAWMQEKGLTFGLKEKADIYFSQIQKQSALLTIKGVSHPVTLKCLGEYNLYNTLAAVGAAHMYGLSLEEICHRLQTIPEVPGRLEKVPLSLPFQVFVDFAHSGVPLAQVLNTLRPITEGRLIVVFGCGGNRDPLRRSGMAHAAEQFADLAVVTSDNPREEAPEKIIREILSHFSSKQQVYVEADRTAAILWAIENAKAGDTVLIAGKGHEKTQIFAHTRIPFDDVEVAKRAAFCHGILDK